MKTFILIIVVFMDCADSQYPDCVNCPNGEWPRCEVQYSTCFIILHVAYLMYRYISTLTIII